MIKIRYNFWVGDKAEERIATLIGVGSQTKSGFEGKSRVESVFWVYDKAGHLIELDPASIIQVGSVRDE